MDQQKNILTVFTPTYNRGYILPKLYQTLLDQTSHNFRWLVIDDGSTDDTKNLIQSWAQSSPFPINYIFVENGGKQRAINRAIQEVSSDYLFIVDSDDQLLANCIQTILDWVEETKEYNNLAGFAGLIGSIKDKEPLKGYISKENKISHSDAFYTEREKYNLTADMAEVFKMSILKNYSYEVHPKEKFIPESYVLNLIAQDGYQFRWYNKVIYLCEYIQDGYTKNGAKLTKENPRGFALNLLMNLKQNKLSLNKMAIITVRIIAILTLCLDFTLLKKHPNLFFCALCFPIGVLAGAIKKYQWRKL